MTRTMYPITGLLRATRFLVVFASVFNIVLLTSCNYTPTEVYFKNVTKAIGGNSVITLNSLTQLDTLVITKTTTVNFNFATQTGANILKVEVSLGGTVIYSSPLSQGFFQIDDSPSLYGTFSTLKIDVTKADNNGSLASSFGLESVDTWDSWVIEYFNPPPTPVIYTSVKNGFLELNWTPLPAAYKKYFTNYTINISLPYERQIVISNPNTSTYADSAYLEGISRTFSLTLNAGSFSVTTQSLTKIENLTANASFDHSDSAITVQWSKSKYPAALSKVQIYVDGIFVANINDGADTTVVGKPRPILFGKTSAVVVNYLLKYPYPNYTLSSAFASLKNPIAQGFLYFGQTPFNNVSLYAQNLSYSKANDEFILNTSTSPLRFANLTTRTKDSLYLSSYYNLVVPYPGDFIYNSSTQINVSQKTFVNLPLSGATFIDGADNQYIATSYNIFDMVSNSPIFSLDVQDISDDGKFALYHNFQGITIYSLTGNPYQNQASIPPGYHSLQFRPDNCTELYNYASSKISILSSIDGSLKRTITVPTGWNVLNYDPVTKTFLATNSQTYMVYLINIDTLVQTQIIAIGSNCSLLLNGYLFSTDGGYVKIM